MAEQVRSSAKGFARNMGLLAASVMVVLMVIQIFFIYPRFITRAVGEFSSKAVRDGIHIKRMFSREQPLERRLFTAEIIREILTVQQDFILWKIKFFSPEGEIVYSTDERDIGRINERDYFHDRVAKGEVHAIPVWAKEVTLEGQVVPVDVVETYVPIMNDGRFMGACEIYYDITADKRDLDRLITQASITTFAIGGVLLAMVVFLATKVENSLRRQEMLQEDLIRSDRLAALGTLVGGMTHEFNNINLTVMGFSQLLLERDDLPAEVVDYLQRINRAAGRANTITNSLLDFSRKGGGSYRRGNIAAAVAEALSLIRGPYEKEGIVVRDLVESVPDSSMDHDQIVQVLLNIVTNSRHAMVDRDRKVLTVRTGREGAMVYASVSDTGCGIPAEHLSQVFTPFYSTKGEHAGGGGQTKIRGTGLGLSVSHTIMKNHGGDISLESRAGEGTVFTISLPVMREGEEEAGGGEAGERGI